MDHSGSGQWQQYPPGMKVEQLRSPKSLTQTSAGVSLSPTAAPFVPRQYSSVPQQHPQHHQEHRNRGDNSGAGGGGGGGGGGSYSIHPMVSQYQHDVGNNGTMVNGTDTIVKSSLADRLKQVRLSDSGSQQQQQPQQSHQPSIGQYSYNDNKDIRNSSHYNHHHHHANQHYPQHSQQHRLQNQHHHQSHHQQQGQQQHIQLHQNHQFAMAGMGYSSTALNNHLHHPILGGIAAVANAGGPSMMTHENKYNSSGRSRSHNSQNLQMHHHQDNHHHHHHQQSHQYHQQMQQHHPGSSGNNGYGGGNSISDQITEDETSALDYLTEVITELYDNPGMFENIQRKLKNTFVEFRCNGFVIANAVELIFEQSIKEQNFRYMGARLIQLLDSLDNGPNSTMREALQQKMDHQHGELHSFMTSEQIKVRGTILFLAELYMQLRSADNDRNKAFAMRIINTAHILLKKEGPENIKCVCQCLKLCGFELERDCREELLQILEILRSAVSQNACSTGRLIHSVLDLQEKSWGRNEEVVPIVQQTTHSESAYDDFNGSPVFYGPDGEELTEEENNFLEMAAPPISFEDLDDDEDADELVDDENMDLEIKMAFKDFVASSRNRQPY